MLREGRREVDTKLFFLAQLLFLVPAACGSDDVEPAELPVADASPHPWRGWKPGAFARYEIRNDFLDKRVKVFSRNEKHRLLSAAEESISLEISREGAPHLPEKETIKLPLSIGNMLDPVSNIQWGKGARKIGEEVLNMGGDSYPCEIWRAQERVAQDEGRTWEYRQWMADESSLLVRLEARRVGDPDSDLLFGTELVGRKERIKLESGESLECRVYKSMNQVDGAYPISTRSWHHPDVPGGLVRSVEESSVEKKTIELLDYGGVRRSK